MDRVALLYAEITAGGAGVSGWGRRCCSL